MDINIFYGYYSSMKMSNVVFCGKPSNYKKIDNSVSRSAQPKAEDFKWLKKQGVTDVVNFRTMYVAGQDFEEKTVVEKNGMRYHNIPSYTRTPTEENVGKFLDIVEDVKSRGGKAHIHCKAGADRTGMYAWIYKHVNKLGDMKSNKQEMLDMGHHDKLYPKLIGWIEKLLKKTK